MGVVATWLSVPADVWPAVLPRIRAAGVAVGSAEPDGATTWYACAREPCRVELGYSPEDAGRQVILYTSVRRCWRRPVGMWRLLRDVGGAVRAAGGKPDSP